MNLCNTFNKWIFFEPGAWSRERSLREQISQSYPCLNSNEDRGEFTWGYFCHFVDINKLSFHLWGIYGNMYLLCSQCSRVFVFVFFFVKLALCLHFCLHFDQKQKHLIFPLLGYCILLLEKKRKKHIYPFLVWLGPLHPLISLLLDFHCSSRSLDGLSMITVMEYS